MSILWKPNGKLNVATDSCDLPEEAQGGAISSGAMTRCKNLRLDQAGVAKLRDGSSKINTTALEQTEINKIIELSGTRYTFCGIHWVYYVTQDWEATDDLIDDTVKQFTRTSTQFEISYVFDWELLYLQGQTETEDDPDRGMWLGKIYLDESEIEDQISAAQWSGIVYNPYNSDTQSIYCLNEIDRKRIEGSTVYEWGIAAPTIAPSISSAASNPYTKLLLHMDGTDESITFTDTGVTTHTVTANGNAQIDTAQYRFATASGLFDGTGDYLSIPDHADFNFGDGIFSIEFFVRFTALPGETKTGLCGSYEGANRQFGIFVWSSGGTPYCRFEAYDGASNYVILYFEWPTIAVNTWYHIAIIRGWHGNGDNWALCLNGVANDVVAKEFTMPDLTSEFRIPHYNDGECSPLNGHIDEFRILKGSAVSTSNFTPPQEEYADATSGLTGEYSIKYTYCRKEDGTVITESNPSVAAIAPVILADEFLSATWTASDDPQVTHVRTYRTLANGATYYHDEDFAIGTTSGTLDKADSALGSEVETDHNRPPLGSFVVGPNYDGYCFIIKDNLLYFCKAKRPDYWPVSYYIEVSPPQFPGKCLVFFNGQPYYLAQHEIYLIQGTGYNVFFPVAMKALTGAQSIQGACAVANQGIFHVGSDGVYLFSGVSGGDRKVSQAEFEPIFRGEDVNGIPGMSSATTSWVIQFGNKLYLGYASTGYTYPKNCLRIDLDTQRATYLTWSREIRTVVVDEYNGRLLGGDTSGYIWVLEDKSVTTDDGIAIAWEVQSKDFTLQTRAHFPRFTKYDVNASGSVTATGEIILDGEIHQSHTLTGNRNTRKRLIKEGNGERAAIKISGSGPIEIFATEME